jgi:hypothetical protein
MLAKRVKDGVVAAAVQASEKVQFGVEGVPQRLKPDSLQSIYVRPEGRTLQKHEFFRKLLSPTVNN